METMSARRAAAVLALVAAGAVGTARAADRLDRFREVVTERSAALDGADPVGLETLRRELWAVVDEEIAENLASGGPFASAPFLQERLDAFAAAWGGAAFRLRPIGGRGRPVLAGLFTLDRPEPVASLRFYWTDERSGGPRLARAVTAEGMGELRPWPAARNGDPQLLASWVGAGSAGRARPLRLEVWRVAAAGPERVWSSAESFPDGLRAAALRSLTGGVVIRREVDYPGWKPGCDGQTELEAVVRYVPAADRVVRGEDRVVNGWHRELHAAVERLVTALAASDGRAAAALVTDAGLLARLPSRLALEPLCDEARADARGRTVLVAARAEGTGRAMPWSLAWRRVPSGWRLSDAGPVHSRVLQ
jgi:hypothetical protein